MDAVGVVPHQQEVRRRGLHGGDAADGLGGVDDAVGVGVLGHVPHALDGGVFDGLFHGVHVRSLVGHGDGDELKAEGLRHLEVAVIAGRGAQELHHRLPAPGPLTVEQAVGVGLGDGVVHQLQAGVAAHEHLLRLTAQDLREQPLGGRQAGELAVVAHVDAVGHIVLRLLHQGEDVADQIQLGLAGLAPGHVQLQPPGLQVLIFLGHLGVFRLALLCGHLGISSHFNASFLCFLS